MNLKKKTIKKESSTEEALRIMKIRYERKNPCSYLLYLPYGRIMLYTGRKGVKINAIDPISTSSKTLEDFVEKLQEYVSFLNRM